MASAAPGANGTAPQPVGVNDAVRLAVTGAASSERATTRATAGTHAVGSVMNGVPPPGAPASVSDRFVIGRSGRSVITASRPPSEGRSRITDWTLIRPRIATPSRAGSAPAGSRL